MDADHSTTCRFSRCTHFHPVRIQAPDAINLADLSHTVGGDTLWASGYEAYDRMSPAFKAFLEGLHAEHDGNFFHGEAGRLNVRIQQHRGHASNSGEDLRAIQCVVLLQFGLQKADL
jgi:alpha-ketoglutarate-dependent taurine dioxygenase